MLLNHWRLAVPKKYHHGLGQKANPGQQSHYGLQIGLSHDECKIADSHPQLKQLTACLAKSEMDRAKQQQFATWRSGTKHEALSDVQRALSDKLWSLVEQQSVQLEKGAKQATTSVTQVVASKRKPTQKTDYGAAAHPSVLAQLFHNPYTFIPFGVSPRRHQPTPHSIGEVEHDRISGVLELDVKTLSPLLTCSPIPLAPKAEHKTYRALTIGEDVIVPATGVRGALRTLMTVLTGGTLGYVDENLFLTQDRDVHLGPEGKSSPAGTPKRVFLAEIVTAGTAHSPGTIRLGTTRLVRAEKLEQLQRKLPRPEPNKRVDYIWANAESEHGSDLYAEVSSLSEKQDQDHRWKVKLSGRPVNPKSKREGLFWPNGEIIELPPKHWADYQGRNRHGDHPELKPGDLVWLEPDSPERTEITNAAHIKSLQWARWGRVGENLLTLLKKFHPQVIPDGFRDDGLVDEVTDLFGHIPNVAHPHAAQAFAARIRPENLVFFDKKRKVEPTPLVPLSTPHPGCVAFYRDCEDVDDFGPDRPLRGYKVYRNTNERGGAAPWHYKTQGIYHNGRLKDNGNPKQKLNKTCELLAEGETGSLRIAFRDLSKREFAILLLACSVDWRLGGGKPLGLGHCRVTAVKMVDEFGNRSELFLRATTNADAYPPHVDIGEYAACVNDLTDRVLLYHESQRPVDMLRYPRASEENRNTVTVGGHVWFNRHASKRKGSTARGLEVLHVGNNSELSTAIGRKNQIQPQPLPHLEAENPEEGRLFGYDLHVSEENKQKVHQQTFFRKLEPFDSSKHVSVQHQSGRNQSQNRDSRKRGKEDRGND